MTTTIDYEGSTTPMPTTSPSTPAWDPSSQTPLDPEKNADDTSPSPGCINIVSDPPTLQHILLHPSFLNVTLNVIANGGRYENKAIPATVTMINGCLAMRHVLRSTSYALEHEWIKHKHPSPTHDNGLVVVIEGEHHGKYLRCLYHDGYGRTALMIAAVVERVEGSTDCITGEQLKIACDLLCTVQESAEEIKRMKKLIKDTRTA